MFDGVWLLEMVVFIWVINDCVCESNGWLFGNCWLEKELRRESVLDEFIYW